jgi:hypothetical protein
MITIANSRTMVTYVPPLNPSAWLHKPIIVVYVPTNEINIVCWLPSILKLLDRNPAAKLQP